MPESWPSTVPWQAEAASYSEAPLRNVASFQPDSGLAIDRRKSAIGLTEVSFASMLMTEAEMTALMSFYSTTCKDGTLKVSRKHPRTGATVTCKFSEAPSVSAVDGGIWYRVAQKFVIIP